MRTDEFVGILFASASIFILLFQIGHFFQNLSSYHGMKETFNLDKAYVKTFVSIYCLGRIGACFSLTLVDDSLNSCIGCLSTQCALIVAICILRPFIKIIPNILVILAEIFTLITFIVIYAYEGFDVDDSSEGWVLIGISSIIVVLAIINVGYSIYLDCIQTEQQAEIHPEKEEKK